MKEGFKRFIERGEERKEKTLEEKIIKELPPEEIERIKSWRETERKILEMRGIPEKRWEQKVFEIWEYLSDLVNKRGAEYLDAKTSLLIKFPEKELKKLRKETEEALSAKENFLKGKWKNRKLLRLIERTPSRQEREWQEELNKRVKYIEELKRKQKIPLDELPTMLKYEKELPCCEEQLKREKEKREEWLELLKEGKKISREEIEKVISKEEEAKEKAIKELEEEIRRGEQKEIERIIKSIKEAEGKSKKE